MHALVWRARKRCANGSDDMKMGTSEEENEKQLERGK
jgi:hypothetical protein